MTYVLNMIHICPNIDVLCVASFTFNLISVSKLTKNLSCCLIFLGDCCFIQDLAQWSTIDLGKEQNGLFLLQDSDYKTHAFALVATVSPISSSDLLHSVVYIGIYKDRL